MWKGWGGGGKGKGVRNVCKGRERWWEDEGEVWWEDEGGVVGG